jgi:hypothetical protein
MKVCRVCGETKPVTAFAARADTGGRRNQCTRCRNIKLGVGTCDGCGKTFGRHSDQRVLCPRCRPEVTKPCATCGIEFVGSTEQRRYCSPECRDSALKNKRAAARLKQRMEMLQAYGGPSPCCSCCGEGILQFLALDHIDGGGGRQREELGGGGFLTWLRRNNYPAGFRLLCHNCNFGRQLNDGICPHEQKE